MGKEHLIGIDIGTYESKGVIVDLEGRVIAQAARPHGLELPKPGWAEHDADAVWWSDFCALCRALLDQSGLHGTDIGAVGCSTIAPCVLPIDKSGKPLRRAILYGIDTRATAQIDALERELGTERIMRVGGNALSAQSVGPKIRWLHDHEPSIFHGAHKFLTGTSYLVYRLTGEHVVDYYTSFTFGPMFDIQNLVWDDAMCAAVVEPERLPRMQWTAEVVGEVLSSAAEETGLAVGTPVIAGTADAAAEAVSVGVVAPGQMMLMYGSTMFFIQITPELLVDSRLWASVYLFPGTYALVAGMATSGAITRWFRDNFAKDYVDNEQKTGTTAYARLANEAQGVPEGSEGLMVLPYFAGERTPLNDPFARGVIAGLTLAHTRAHVYRAILEGTAYGVRHNLEVMEELGRPPDDVVAVGGGTRNQLWLQLVSDVCGINQRVPEKTFGASYGDAFLAGYGAGFFDDFREIRNWVATASEVQTDAEGHRFYEEYYRLYRELYEASKSQVHRLARLAANAL